MKVVGELMKGKKTLLDGEVILRGKFFKDLQKSRHDSLVLIEEIRDDILRKLPNSLSCRFSNNEL